jgi:type IV pilus assembly protein PilE
MVVLLIVSVLLMIALPAYREQVLSSHRALARTELRKVAVRQELYFIEQRQYAASLGELGLPAGGYAIDARGAIRPGLESGSIYRVHLATTDDSYSLQAEPIGKDARCGTLSLDGLGRTAATGSGGTRLCW